MSNVEGWNRFAQTFFYKIDRSTQKLTTGRIHSFDIHYSIFDILFFKVSFSIRLAAFQVGGAARVVTPCEQGASDLVTSGPASGLLLENEYAGHPKQYICNTGSKFSNLHGLQNVPGFC
jgi:hypothetical protein